MEHCRGADAELSRLHRQPLPAFFDGQLLGRGPARSDFQHYVYETYAVSAAPGPHTLAALVLSYCGAHCPIAEVHEQGAFVLEAQTESGEIVCATGQADWRVQTDTAYQPAPITRQDGCYAVGASEMVDGRLVPHGWEQPGFDDTDWKTPAALFDAYRRERPSDTANPGTASGSAAMRELAGYADCPLPAVDGGEGANVQIVYAEAMTQEGRKSVRDGQNGTDVAGFADTYLPGGDGETYSPLHWRAFRFVKLILETADERILFRDFSYIFTGYPWECKAEFTVADGPASLPAVQKVDFRTA